MLPGRPEDLRAAVRARLLNPKGPPVIIIVDDLDTVSWTNVNFVSRLRAGFFSIHSTQSAGYRNQCRLK